MLRPAVAAPFLVRRGVDVQHQLAVEEHDVRYLAEQPVVGPARKLAEHAVVNLLEGAALDGAPRGALDLLEHALELPEPDRPRLGDPRLAINARG